MIADPLTAVEREIYDCFRKFMRRTKNITFDTVVARCRAELEKTLSDQEITRGVQSLLERRYIIKGTTLCRDDVLENAVRKKMLKFIQVNPGAYNRLIRRELHIGSNEFTWHIGILEKFGLVKKILFHNRHYAYFEDREFMGHEYDMYLLKNSKIERLLGSIKKLPKTTSQIATELGIHYSTIQRYLRLLYGRNLVTHPEDWPGQGGKKEKSRRSHYVTNGEMLIKIRKIVNSGVFIDFGELYPEEPIPTDLK